MASGGSRPGAGRPPAEHSRAKDRAAARAAKGKPVVIDDGTWLTLPHEGRGGNPPAWPLSVASKRERDVWRRLWKTPEALGWDRTGSDYQVALHVRTLVRAEQPESPIGISNLVRLQQAELGLTPGGKKTLRWRVGRPPHAQAAAPEPPKPEPAPVSKFSTGRSPKDRMRLVSSDG